MKDYDTEKWIDFVNEMVSMDERKSMEEHLKQGCKRCQQTVSFWQKVRHMAAMEANYLPPNDTVRLAKAAFSGSGLTSQKERTADRIRVLFDSFLQPTFEGARSACTASRQLLYRAEPFHIDIHIEVKPGGGMVVSGQLLNINDPEIMARDARVVLSNMQGQSIQTAANEFGEFSGEIVNSGDLQVTIVPAGSEPIVISHRQALGRAPEELR